LDQTLALAYNSDTMLKKHKQMKNKNCGIIDKGILRGSVYDLHPHDKALRLHYALIA
jgi:hypothetical protein